ncbi:DUF6122 family protein [Aquimarina litoralis]|uniref:DUF6122 family protein n=1 Tax=Aquimarina litoralis TaxID=584605 RepID=UPI001C56D542|nr:DUF6122 family protein [Aquimarina litoralis]MBW1294516.1 hypothetical protein [Aquimarina litoralis]
MYRPIIHYGFHFLIPLGIAVLFFPKKWKTAYIVFLSAMLIDLDHLAADPIFDPNRCSVGYHFLHSIYAIIAYFILLFPKRTRVIAIALLWHIVTDWVDCQMI